MNGFISYYAQRAFMLSKNTGVLALTMIAPVLLNVGLNIYLIPLHGLKGAIWATVASYGLGLVLSLIVARRYFPLPLPLKALLQTGFASAVMAGVVLSLPASINALPDPAELLIKAGVGVAVYGFVAFAINAANCRELIKDLLAKIKSRRSGETVEA